MVDAGCFRNSDGDVASGNAIINTYNFTTESDVPPLGSAYEGGNLICASGGNLWIAAPYSTQVYRSWYNRTDANTTANDNAACGDWFVPTCGQYKNPGNTCRTYWTLDSHVYWSNTERTPTDAWMYNFSNQAAGAGDKGIGIQRVRAFRCVSY